MQGSNQQGTQQVLPCEWQSDTHIGILAALPSNQKPVTDSSWDSQDAAFDDIVQSLKMVLKIIYMT